MITALITILAPFIGALLSAMMVDGLSTMVEGMAEIFRADSKRYGDDW